MIIEPNSYANSYAMLSKYIIGFMERGRNTGLRHKKKSLAIFDPIFSGYFPQ